MTLEQNIIKLCITLTTIEMTYKTIFFSRARISFSLKLDIFIAYYTFGDGYFLISESASIVCDDFKLKLKASQKLIRVT